MNGIGMIGMGTMGLPMAGHLAKSLAGSDSWMMVWSRTPGKGDSLQEHGVTLAVSIEELANCGVIVLCISRDEDVRAVLASLLPVVQSGTLFIDHSTTSPGAAMEFHQTCQLHGCAFLDAPITGGSMGAQAGTLTIFCGGTEESYARALPVMTPYAKRTAHVGGAGAGQMMKMANQIAVGGALIGLCESLAFAEKAGLDLALTRELLSGGAAGSWAFENYGPKILNRDWTPGFRVDHQRKDFGYCLEAADQLGIAIPATALTDELLSALDRAGRSGDTTAALFDVLSGRVPLE